MPQVVPKNDDTALPIKRNNELAQLDIGTDLEDGTKVGSRTATLDTAHDKLYRARKHLRERMRAGKGNHAIHHEATLIAAVVSVQKRQRHRGARNVGGKKPEKHKAAYYNRVESIAYEAVDETVDDMDTHEEKCLCCNWESAAEAISWLMALLLGIVVSLVTNLLILCFYSIVKAKDKMVDYTLADYGWAAASGQVFAVSIGAGVIAIFCVLCYPAAAASGIPSLLAYLNGVQPIVGPNAFNKITQVFSLPVLCAKFLGTVAALCTGLFIGPEGPIIHIGAILGKLSMDLLDRFDDKIFNKPRLFGEVLGDGERRDFIAIGAGAGIAAAFSAPLAGVMFVVEEAASVLTVRMIELAFLACVFAYWITNFVTQRDQEDGHVKFDSPQGPYCQSLVTSFYRFFVFILIGILGGLLGALFNAIIEHLNHFRQRKWSSVRKRSLEAMMMIVLTMATCLILSSQWGCTKLDETLFVTDSVGCLHEQLYKQVSEGMVKATFAGKYYNLTDLDLKQDQRGWVREFFSEGQDGRVYLIDPAIKPKIKIKTLMQGTCEYGEYNELATLLLRSGTSSVKNLFTRGAPHMFSVPVLVIFLIVYFVFAAITSGIAVPSGLFVPQILIGATMGQLICQFEIYCLNQYCTDLSGFAHDTTFFQWAYGGYRVALAECRMPDPGTYSIIGAAAFLGGSGRISVFLAVVMLELTNDISVLPVVAYTVMIAMIVGNIINHGLYHALLNVLSLPFMNPKSSVEMRFYPVSLVMTKRKNLRCLQKVDTADNIVDILNSQHNAFPVVDNERVVGLVVRDRLQAALKDGFERGHIPLTLAAPYIMYEDISISKAYDAFRSLGLRHLCCITRDGNLAGMITRKDLMIWKLHERLDEKTGRAHIRHGHHH